MNKFMAILELAAIIAVLSPMTGQAQQHHRALVSALHRFHFKIHNLSTREDGKFTIVDGEITSNAKKEARTVFILVRWFDKDGKVLHSSGTAVSNLAPGETLPFAVSTLDKNPASVRYDVTIDSVQEQLQ